MLLPALSAFTAYLLCRHLTRSTWASLVGGYLFGFSSYMLGQEQGHLHMTAVFLLPLIALATVRYLQGELDGRGFAWRLGVLFGLQFWLSTELAASPPRSRSRSASCSPSPRCRRPGAPIRAIWRPLARRASGSPSLLAAPLLYYAHRVPVRLDQLAGSSSTATCLNFLVPTQLHLGRRALASLDLRSTSAANDAEAGAYLGIPTLVIVAWYALGARRSAVARFLLAALAVAARADARHGARRQGAHRVLAPVAARSRGSRSSTTSCRRGSRSTRRSPPP